MAPVFDFPPELHDLVIDHMHDEKQSLATFGLVSRAWLRSSRHHLFASVTLQDHNWEAFLRLLDPPLATFVQSIRSLSISPSDELKLSLSFNELIPQLPIFPALTHLRLSYINWAGVSDATVGALGALFGNITTLSIHLLTFDTPHHMATFVSRFPRLEELLLYPAFMQFGTAPQQLRQPDAPRSLRTVRYHSGMDSGSLTYIATWLHAGRHPPAIRALELGMLSAKSLPHVGDLLRGLRTELHELDLTLMYHITPADIETHLDLSQNTRLEHLTLHLSLRRFHSARGAAHAPWALLAALRSSITTLTVVLKLDSLDVLDNLDWEYLNTALQTRPQLAALHRLHFMVHCASGAMDEVEGALRSRVSASADGVMEVSVLHTSRIFTHSV
ncbi:hypothetical protein DFH09DRAFT_159209 [Mycena vulgaris]|nr:hypothetical protein DFH09DRAFT_159209 [Mycena vulgaris]